MTNCSLIFFAALSLATHIALFELWPTSEQRPQTLQQSLIEIGIVSVPHLNSEFIQDRNPSDKTARFNKQPSRDQNSEATQIKEVVNIPLEKDMRKTDLIDPTITIHKENAPLAIEIASSSQPDSSPIVATKAAPLRSRNLPPDYPETALRYRWEGEVWLKVLIDRSGGVKSVIVEQSSDYNILDQAAVKRVESWEFEPARIGGESTEGVIRIPIRFKLKRD
ncbi:MAG: energy transducer TonB [Desulfuromonadales bacterium]|nr:energy transducer TonB [Desulfuromonadales bacterium]